MWCSLQERMSSAQDILMSVIGTTSMIFQMFNIVIIPEEDRDGVVAEMILYFEEDGLDVPFDKIPELLSAHLCIEKCDNRLRRCVFDALELVVSQTGSASEIIRSVRLEVSSMFTALVEDAHADIQTISPPPLNVAIRNASLLDSIHEYAVRNIQRAAHIVQKVSGCVF